MRARASAGAGLGFAPRLTLLLLLGPVAAGLIGTALPAFGYLPALGGEGFTLAPWRAFLEAPGVSRAIVISFTTGVLASAVSLAIVVLFCAAWHGTRVFSALQRLLSPLLSLPHATVAFGLAFLIAPSGWLMRLVSPWATGLERPPDLIVVNDPAGLALVAGLVVKEVPFLLLMTLAALGQAEAAERRTVARSLGYGPMTAWLKGVLPVVYPQVRLPVFAVLAFSMSVVDVALILGPSTPPTLAVQLVKWFHDPDLARRFVASAGAVVQLGLVVAAIALWWLVERAVARLGRLWIVSGRRGRGDLWLRLLAAGTVVLSFGSALFGLLGMAVWSLAGFWRYPDALPGSWTLANWARHADEIATPAVNTLTIGLAAAAVAAVLAVACLEHEAQSGRRAGARALWLLYLPLLIPQIAFLFGAQVLLVTLRLDGWWLAVAWSHLVFVLPYVFLSLSDPYRSWDDRYARSARCLGASWWRMFWRVKLPMLLRPILIAAAVGFAVSAGLYLPTLFAGAGRTPTLLTEAISLSAGGDRRIIGIYAILQLVTPFIAFALALITPAFVYRHRRGMQVTR
ncbi:MAG: ABC transporter permease subunit [Rhodovibrionaceae bacterium]|nr:ABC transporter permease subunit [Rhodovibrionaceae bacterium]